MLDIITFCLILCSCILGFMRGLTSEVMRIIVWVIALTATYGITQSTLITQYIKVPKILSYVLIFILFFIVFKILSHFIVDMIKATKFKSLDRSLGFCYGMLRGIAFTVFLYLMAGPILPSTIQDHLSKTFLHYISHGSITMLPQRTQHWCHAHLKEHHHWQATPAAHSVYHKLISSQIVLKTVASCKPTQSKNSLPQ